MESIAPVNTADSENAILALMSLGYNKATAVKAVNDAIKGGATHVEQIIANALRSLA